MSESDSVPLSSVCCEKMRGQLESVCTSHSSAAGCPDALVGRFGRGRAYGLCMMVDRRSCRSTIAPGVANECRVGRTFPIRWILDDHSGLPVPDGTPIKPVVRD
jgi:hypothetical protein